MIETRIDTRLPDFDAMGIVHHATYAFWFEIARLDFFDKYGFSFNEQNAMGLDPVMVDLDLRYHAPINRMGTATVQTKLLLLDEKKMRLQYECCFDGQHICTGTSFHIWTLRSKENGSTRLKSVSLGDVAPEFYEKLLSLVEAE